MALEYLNDLSLSESELQKLQARAEAKDPVSLLSLIIWSRDPMAGYLKVSLERMDEIARKLENLLSDEQRERLNMLRELQAQQDYPYPTGVLLDAIKKK